MEKFNAVQKAIIDVANKFAVDLESYINPNMEEPEINLILDKLISIKKEGLQIDWDNARQKGVRGLSDYGFIEGTITKAILDGEITNSETDITKGLTEMYPPKNITITGVELDEEQDNPPKLKLSDKPWAVLNFRNYYWTNINDTMNGANPNQVNVRDTSKFENPIELIKHVLKGSNVQKETFTDEEKEYIDEWIKYTERFYGRTYFKSNLAW